MKNQEPSQAIKDFVEKILESENWYENLVYLSLEIKKISS